MNWKKLFLRVLFTLALVLVAVGAGGVCAALLMPEYKLASVMRWIGIGTMSGGLFFALIGGVLTPAMRRQFAEVREQVEDAHYLVAKETLQAIDEVEIPGQFGNRMADHLAFLHDSLWPEEGGLDALPSAHKRALRATVSPLYFQAQNTIDMLLEEGAREDLDVALLLRAARRFDQAVDQAIAALRTSEFAEDRALAETLGDTPLRATELFELVDDYDADQGLRPGTYRLVLAPSEGAPSNEGQTRTLTFTLQT